MSIDTPVCESLGIERPIVQAPLSADPRLPAAVSNAGALGSVALWWADDAGALVRETAALTDRPFAGNFVAWLGTRFLLADEMPIHEEYRRRLIAAAETDAEWYANLYEVGWPDAPHRAIHNSTAERWDAAGRPPPGSRPGEGEVIAHFASGEPILRYSPAPPLVGTTGEIEALSLWAGQSVALAKESQPAADIVAELVSRL